MGRIEKFSANTDGKQIVWCVSVGETKAATHIWKVFSTEEKARTFVKQCQDTMEHKFNIFDVEERVVE